MVFEDAHDCSLRMHSMAFDDGHLFRSQGDWGLSSSDFPKTQVEMNGCPGKYLLRKSPQAFDYIFQVYSREMSICLWLDGGPEKFSGYGLGSFDNAKAQDGLRLQMTSSLQHGF